MAHPRFFLQRSSPILLLALIIASLLWGISSQSSTSIAQANPQWDQDARNGPFMGWSTWNFLGSHVTEATFEAQAQAEASKLKQYGYRYVLLDDFWYLNPAVTVDKYGRWVVDPVRFPHGLSAVASYVHKLGLKFGAYLTPGIPLAAVSQNTPIQGTPYHAKDIADTSKTELNYNFGHGNKVPVMYYIDYSKPGAQAYINSWARQLASWGVDFLKIDGVGDWDIPDVQAWSSALRHSGRDIYFDLSNSLDVKNAAIWYHYANSWRIDGDIECYKSCPGNLVNWSRIVRRFTDAPQWAAYSGHGRANDLDALDVSNGTLDGITNDERQTYMTLWAISGAPLNTADDLTNTDAYGLQLLTNREVIALDQSGEVATPISQATSQQVWRVRNEDGSYTVALFNLGDTSATVTVNWADLGFMSGSARVRDLWSHTNLGTFSTGFSASLNTHASRLLRVTPQFSE